ncbi:hypothetical protein ACYULU_16660 [Breznakiellaceae bacterium SP9]
MKKTKKLLVVYGFIMIISFTAGTAILYWCFGSDNSSRENEVGRTALTVRNDTGKDMLIASPPSDGTSRVGCVPAGETIKWDDIEWFEFDLQPEDRPVSWDI